MGQTADQFGLAAYSLAVKKLNLTSMGRREEICWIRLVSRIYEEYKYVLKPEGLFRPRTEGLNKGEVAVYFNLLATVLEEHDILDKPQK